MNGGRVDVESLTAAARRMHWRDGDYVATSMGRWLIVNLLQYMYDRMSE